MEADGFHSSRGKKAGCWSLIVKTQKHLKSRVVRSSSCTIRIPELDLQVNPGSNATGYVSNVEGVINRFVEVINMVLRDLQNEISAKLNDTETVNLIQALKKLNNLNHCLID